MASDQLPPVNMIGDFGGGGAFLALGIVAAMWEAKRSGVGQVIDAAMVDGSAVLTTMMHGLMAQGRWRDEAGVNFADTGSPFYEVYECADGRFVGVGAIEGPFYGELLERSRPLPRRAARPAGRGELAGPEGALRGRVPHPHPRRVGRALRRTDACVAPVLSLTEAPAHPHNVARGTFVVHGGIVQPAPAPRFSRTPSTLGHTPPAPGDDTAEILIELGLRNRRHRAAASPPAPSSRRSVSRR